MTMSKPITVTIPHQLGRIEARRRLEQGFGRIREQISGRAVDVEESWQGDRLSFRAGVLGQSITGHLDVMDDSVRVEVDLPWFLASIAEKMKGRLQHEGQLLLSNK